MYLQLRFAHSLLAVAHQRFMGKLISDIKTAAETRHALMQPNVLID